jgi:hypothetical protein
MIRVCRSAMIAAGLSLATVAGATGVQAADIYDKGARVPYDDPRYAYLYGRYGTPPPPGWETRRHGEHYGERSDPAGLWRHRRVETHPEAWRERDRRWDRHAEVPGGRFCPPKSVVRGRLKAEGWFAFADPEVIDARFVSAEARHETGGRYRITVERCTGRVVGAEPLGRHRRYAERDEDEFFNRFDHDNRRRRPYAWGRDDRDDRYVHPRGRY